jgi:hypothetical protein
LVIVACVAVAYQHRLEHTSQQPSTIAKPQPSPTPLGQANPNQETNSRFVRQFSERIAGHENEPAERVFKNIQIEWFKNVPAGQFLRVMNGGYSRALGVACTHCHVEQDFASDNKRPKRAAREMAVMHKMINDQLGKMQNLEIKPGGRFINCSTCHRGAINPMAADP